MKKLLFFFAFFTAVFLTWQSLMSREEMPETKTYNIEVDNRPFKLAFIKVASPSPLALIPNFSEKLSSKEIMQKYNCQKGINSGFYDKNHNPLGLLISGEKVLNPKRESNFFNGYFYITKNGDFNISQNLPDESLFLAVQSGPLLMINQSPLPLKIIDDKPARRMVVAKTMDNQLYFLAIYDKGSPLQGPLLSDLPKILSPFTNLGQWQSALNLDGGTASAFYNESVELTELASVGGWFCVR